MDDGDVAAPSIERRARRALAESGDREAQERKRCIAPCFWHTLSFGKDCHAKGVLGLDNSKRGGWDFWPGVSWLLGEGRDKNLLTLLIPFVASSGSPAALTFIAVVVDLDVEDLLAWD